MGTPTASTKAAPFISTTSSAHVPQPSTVWLYRWRELRKMRTKKSLLAVWAYRLPAMRKLGIAMA